MKSTTNQKIRMDNAGSGTFGSPRGLRTHNGIDELCTPGQIVTSPISGRVIRLAYPYKDQTYGGLLIQNKNFKVKVFYINPDSWIVGEHVNAGDRIGLAQDITKRYPKDKEMKPHVHVEALVNPLFIRTISKWVESNLITL